MIIAKLIHHLRLEFATVMRFGLVGGSSLGVKVGCYALLSRVLWTSGPRSLENIMALGVSMIYNYILHRFWTFKHQKPASGSGPRYVAVVIAASVLDASMFYVGHDILRIYDFVVLIGSAFVVAVFTFLAHRLYTFSNNPYRKTPDVVQSA